MLQNLKNAQIESTETDTANRGRPRWPAVVALLMVGVLYAIISQERAIIPSWALLPILVVMIVLINISHRRGHLRLNQLLIYATVGLATVILIASVILLVLSLPNHKTGAGALLGDAIVLWVTNIIVFALWYWLIDGGGPVHRRNDYHESADLLFPQTVTGDKTWIPGFIDYVFLAFNTNTAFSPTDTAVMSRRAKIVMMVQASLSLMMLAVLAARAINIF